VGRHRRLMINQSRSGQGQTRGRCSDGGGGTGGAEGVAACDTKASGTGGEVNVRISSTKVLGSGGIGKDDAISEE